MNKKTKFVLISLPIVAVIAVVIGIWLLRWGSQEYRGPAEKITVAAYAGDTAALVWIAEEQGYYTENGLEVTIKPYEAGKLAADTLLANEADIATSSDFVFVSNSFARKDLRVLGTVARFETCEFMARKDHGIEKISQLTGKRVGITKKSCGEFFLGTFLTFNHLTLDQVEIIDLTPPEIIEAMVNGDIDAALTWDPNIYIMKSRLGSTVVSWPAQSGQSFYFLLLTTDKWLQKHPLVAKRFLRALLQAEEFVESNNLEAQNAIRERFNYEPSYMQSVWPKHDFLVMLPQDLLLLSEDQARWRIENNLTDKKEVPNYLDYIYLEGLEELKPEAVTIIH